jgi:hypothetical protein
MFFQTVKIQGQVSHQTLKVFAFSLESVDLLASGVTGCVTTRTLLACLHELLGPRVEVVGLDHFTATQFVDCDLTTKAFEDHVDLISYGVIPASR